MKVKELKYSTTNTYLIIGEKGRLMLDTGWAGTFSSFCNALGTCNERVQDIDYILITHYHPDHMGIVQEIADKGPKIMVMDVQKDYIHSSDMIFEKDNKCKFYPIKYDSIVEVAIDNSREFLKDIGIDGEIIHTPGHSDDSVSLLLDSGELFVGDLNPLYELELHRGTVIGETWDVLLARNPKTIYYGHAKTWFNNNYVEKAIDKERRNITDGAKIETRIDIDVIVDATRNSSKDTYKLVQKIVKCFDKGMHIDKICDKTGADKELVDDVIRMYVTHPGVTVQGILDRIEIKGK